MNNLGSEIKQARENVGMTQKTLAKLLGTTTQTIWRWEKGERQPKWETIQNIAKILNAPQIVNIFEDFTSNIKNSSFTLGYWGNVVDNVQNVLEQGTSEEIEQVRYFLEIAYKKISQQQNNTALMKNNALIKAGANSRNSITQS